MNQACQAMVCGVESSHTLAGRLALAEDIFMLQPSPLAETQ